jgi:hypothetical protein
MAISTTLSEHITQRSVAQNFGRTEVIAIPGPSVLESGKLQT